MDLSGPTGMRVIVRKERPHPGAQLRITDVDGLRVTAFATTTKTGVPARNCRTLELRHRRRTRCEDRIRVSKDTGMMNLPLHDFNQNRIRCAIFAPASPRTHEPECGFTPFATPVSFDFRLWTTFMPGRRQSFRRWRFW